MLVLTRKIGDEIIINGEIRITITAVRGERIRIGVTAPKRVEVHRGEARLKRQERADKEGVF